MQQLKKQPLGLVLHAPQHRVTKMNERIKQIQLALGMSQKDFAEAIGIAPGALSNIYSNRTNATSNHVKGIHSRFPKIDINWLMFGEGEMYGANHSAHDAAPTPKDTIQATSAMHQNMPDPTQYITPKQQSAMAGDASLFNQPQTEVDELLPFQTSHDLRPIRGSVQPYNQPQNVVKNDAKNIDIKKRQVKEIRVFFDDGTYETFLPGK